MANQHNIDKHKFKPGQSGNPAGKPPGTLSSKTLIRNWLEKSHVAMNPTTGEKERMTVFDSMIVGLAGKAMKGDASAFGALMDRLEGKVSQKLEHAGGDGNPIKSDTTHRVIFENYSAKVPDNPTKPVKAKVKPKPSKAVKPVK